MLSVSDGISPSGSSPGLPVISQPPQLTTFTSLKVEGSYFSLKLRRRIHFYLLATIELTCLLYSGDQNLSLKQAHKAWSLRISLRINDEQHHLVRRSFTIFPGDEPLFHNEPPFHISVGDRMHDFLVEGGLDHKIYGVHANSMPCKLQVARSLLKFFTIPVVPEGSKLILWFHTFEDTY